jgi:hypothetical protein
LRIPFFSSFLRFFFLFLLIPPLPTFAEEEERRPEVTAGGILLSRLDQDLQKDFPGEDLSELHTKLFASLEIRNPDRYRLYGSFLLEHNYLWDGERLKASATLLPWEVSLRWEREKDTIEGGNLIRRFGRGLPSLWDIVNPPDFTEGPGREDEFQKLPIPMIRWTRYGEEWEVELIYSPFYRPPRTPSLRSDWGILRITDFEGLETYPLVQQALSQEIFPGIVSYPPDDLVHGEIALRLSRTFPHWDLDLFAFYGYDRLPLPEFHPDFIHYLNRQSRPLPELIRSLSVQELILFNPLYELKPRRALFLGGSALTQTPLGSLRFELQGVSGEPIYRSDLTLLRRPALHALIGLDSLSRESFLYSLSLIAIQFLTEEDLFLIHPFTLALSGAGRGTILPRLSWEFRGLVTFTLGDAWISPLLRYELRPDLILEGGFQLFLSGEGLPLNFFTHNNLGFVRLRWFF